MSYQRGSLKKVKRREGEIWVLRYRVTNSDGRRVENVMPIGLVREFPKDKDAWREADRLGFSVRINDSPLPGRIRFGFLAEHYLRADFWADAVRPKSANTISHVEHIVRAYLVPRFGNEIAEDIKPLDIQRWFKSLHETGGLAWTTIARPKQKAPMATCRYIPCSRASCVHGGHRRLLPPTGILFFHPSRGRAVFPSPRLFSSPIICDRRQRKPECTSRTGRGLDFTTCVTA